MHFVKEFILVVGDDEDGDSDGDGSHYDDYGGIMEGRDGSKHGHCPLGLRATEMTVAPIKPRTCSAICAERLNYKPLVMLIINTTSFFWSHYQLSTQTYT